MKQWTRILAMLLAALTLCGMFSAVAEMEVTIDEVLDAGELDLDFHQDIWDMSLELSDVELVEQAPEAVVAANEAAPVEPNDGEDIFEINKNGVLVKYNGKAANVAIPDNVVVIGKNAFENNARLTHVTIPSGVNTIRSKAFANCAKLTSVTVLATNITIVADAFSGSKPTFYTVVGSDAVKWAQKHSFDVEGNIVLLNQNVNMNAAIGDTYRIMLEGMTALSYSSGNTSVATVSQTGIVKVVNGGTVQITVQLQGGNTRLLTLSVPFPKARLSKRSIRLNAGSSKTLTIENLSGRTVSWTSSNSGIATVNAGTVTAVREGTCTITATLSDGTALTCKVTVKDNARLSKTSLTLKVGHHKTLKVSGLAGRTVYWYTSDSSVASVDGGKVTGKKGGKCTITAQIQNGKTLKCQVTVKDDAKINKTSISLKVGGSYTLKIKHLGGRTVSWSSSNTNVATVQGGKVTGKGAGSCTITARLSDGKTFTCKVNVTESARLSRKELTLKEGETYKLTISGQGSSTVGWQSSDVNIATVDANGVVTAVKAGKCVITARLSSGTNLQCKVTVNRK